MKNKIILFLAVLLLAVSVLAVCAQDTTVNDVVSENVSGDDVISVKENDDGILEDSYKEKLSVDDTNSVKEFDVQMKMIDHLNPNNRGIINDEFTLDDRFSYGVDFNDPNDIVNNYVIKNMLEKYFILPGMNNFKVISSDFSINFLNGGFTRYDVNLVVEYNVDKETPVENNTNPVKNNTDETNNVQNITNNTLNVQNNTANDYVTNNTQIQRNDVLKATGIPFALLIVALLGVGVSIRRRK